MSNSNKNINPNVENGFVNVLTTTVSDEHNPNVPQNDTNGKLIPEADITSTSEYMTMNHNCTDNTSYYSHADAETHIRSDNKLPHHLSSCQSASVHNADDTCSSNNTVVDDVTTTMNNINQHYEFETMFVMICAPCRSFIKVAWINASESF